MLLLGVLLGLLAVGPAGAQTVTPDAEALGLDVALGVGGAGVTGTWAPVEVRLAPHQPFRGQVLVAAGADGGQQLERIDVEVGAGATKRWFLLAPPQRPLTVQVVADGADEAVTVRPDEQRVDGFVVAALGSAAEEIPAVTSPTLDRRSTVVALEAGVLDLGARALQSVSSLVVSEADLAALPDAHREVLVEAAGNGTQLVVTGISGAELGLPWRTATGVADGRLDPAPGAWVTDDGTTAAVAAGRGRLATTTRPTGAVDDWEVLLQPAASAATRQPQVDRLTNDLEQVFRATSREPVAMGWLVAFLVAHVVVVGPVLGVVLSRRRRPELAWVAVPVVTALFATAAFVGASGARPRVGVTATATTWVDGTGTTMIATGLQSPREATHVVELPGAGWAVLGTGWQTDARVDRSDGGRTRVHLELPSLASGGTVGWRAADGAPPLDVEVALVDGQAHVEVANVGGVDLDDVRLHLASDEFRLVDRLAAGDTHVAEVGVPDRLPDNRDMGFGGFEGRPLQAVGGDVTTDDRRALLRLLHWDLFDRAPGVAWVSASTPGGFGIDVPDVEGGASHLGSVVAVGVRPTTTDDVTTPFEVPRDSFLADGTFRDTPSIVHGNGPVVQRFRLPREGDLASLQLALRPNALGRGFVEPMPEAMRCGTIEVRDTDTGDVLRVVEGCEDDMCPPDAQMCSGSETPNGVLTGQACYPDGRCEDFRFTDQPGPGVEPTPGPPPAAVGDTGLQAWDHEQRRWVDIIDPEGPGDLAWVGPLGDVWIRTTGHLEGFDLAPQGVGATLGGGA